MSFDIDVENCGTCEHSLPYENNSERGCCRCPELSRGMLKYHNSFPNNLELFETRCENWTEKVSEETHEMIKQGIEDIKAGRTVRLDPSELEE